MVFLVSQVQLLPDGLPGATASGTEGVKEGMIRGLRIAVRRAAGQKCERCWNYSVRVGEAVDFPSICERCVAALKTMAEEKSYIPNPKS
jgi:isoleucyl-tRNA synthetase